ncbi:MAG: acylphosphatase [Woeseia sp.]
MVFSRQLLRSAGKSVTSDARSAGGSGGGEAPKQGPAGQGTAARCRRFRVTGRVQGVFFRDSTRAFAQKLDLTGYANNRPDGSVEVVACGPPEALDRLADWLRKGPPMASVVGLRATEAEVVNYRKFTIG